MFRKSRSYANIASSRTTSSTGKATTSGIHFKNPFLFGSGAVRTSRFTAKALLTAMVKLGMMDLQD